MIYNMQPQKEIHRSFWVGSTWTPKVCKIMAFTVVVVGLRL